MNAFKPFFLNKMLLLVFIAIGTLVGCEGPGCGNTCTGGFFCPTSKEGCECVANQRGCGNFSFNEEKGKCKISDCRECALFVGTCGGGGTSQQDITLSEFVTVFSLETSCDVVASTDSENDCEDLAIDRECESLEFMPSQEYMFPNECWLYDCQKCLLEMD